ncbi:MAG: DUF1329 domain-containing protein [Planctomycetota bacterium]|jgi:hypothetical protein
MVRRALVLLLVPLCLAAANAARAQEEPPAEVRHEDARMIPAPWALPPVDSCQPEGGLYGWPPGGETPSVPFEPGDSFTMDQLEIIEDFVPPFIWEHRDRFFYAGMRLEIGACFADYSPPDFFKSATAHFAGQAWLTEHGGLENYTAGLPFPPDRMLVGDPQSGLEWAWNIEMRYQAAGFRGRFRTSDMVGRTGRAEPFIGEMFKAQTSFRADRPDDEYTAPGANGKHWVAGGVLFEPFDARHYAWRQYRDVEHMTQPKRSDDLHAYLPNFRRVRRVPAADVEGLYMPSFSVGVVQSQTLSGLGGGMDGSAGGGGGGGAAAAPAAAITTKRSGFEGLEFRPLLYDLRLLGVQDVLTPINAGTPSYPEVEDREFGPWGLAFASDRWDLRRAIVIEGRAKQRAGDDTVSRFIQYVDVQTLAPLYYASWDARDEQIDVGMFVGRWSEDRADYPRWPGDEARPIRVIDPVGASFANIRETGGWRRESWDMVSTPPDDKTFKRTLSVNNLTKRR